MLTQASQQPLPATPTPIPQSLNRAALAFEIAAGLTALPDILSRFKITKDHLKSLLKRDPQFRHQVTEYKREWLAPKNAKERIRFKAQLAAEDGLLELYSIFKDQDAGLTQRLEAYKQIVSLADVAPKKDAVDTGSHFSITINLGESPQEAITIAATTTHETEHTEHTEYEEEQEA